MHEENKVLFARAIFIALNDRFDDELSSAVAVKPSKRHLRVIKAVIREQKIINIKDKKLPLRLLVAAIIALTLLLAGCFAPLLHRNEFASFIEEIYTDHISLIFSDKQETNSDEKIENLYELTYLPEGYELTFKDVSQSSILYQYALNENNTIQLSQVLLGSSKIRFDSKNYKRMIIKGDKEIYCYQSEHFTSYYWSDSNSIIELSVYGDFHKTESENILNGVVLKQK